MKLLTLDRPVEAHDWREFYSNVPLLAPAGAIQGWRGADDTDFYNRWLQELSGDYFQTVRVNGSDLVAFGDITAAYAQNSGVLEGENTRYLIILKWLGAPPGFRLSRTLVLE